MIAKVYSAIPQGYNGHLVEVEGDANRGLPAFNIVGMANKTITESRERVRSAIVNSGFTFPLRKVTINLAPAELAKDGSHLDLPIALAILVLSEQLLPSDLSHRLFVGELSLDGLTKPVRGIINTVEAAKIAGYTEVFLPYDNLPQASLVPDIKLFGVHNLLELFLHLKGQKLIQPFNKNFTQSHSTPVTTNVVEKTYTESNSSSLSVFESIRGQELAKRALTIAIAGRHNLLLSGPPGAGKTMLARAATELLPPPTPHERLEIAKLHSLVTPPDQIILNRPFRSPHHTTSATAIIGGGPNINPGEISLATGGILFLDEIPEFPRNVLEALRQPLEDGTISISRATKHATYPARFMLIATMNPCPCGHLGDPNHECTCTIQQISTYQKRLSGPILDRIDLRLDVQPVSQSDLLQNIVEINQTGSNQSTRRTNVKNTKTGLTPVSHQNVVEITKTDTEHTTLLSIVKNTITDCYQRQFDRYGQPGKFNSSLTSAETSRYIKLDTPTTNLLTEATSKLGLSARSYFKILKIARTIADLDKSTEVRAEHICEALSFRPRKN